MRSFFDIVIKMIRYNLKVVFGNRFFYFLSGAVVFFLLITALNIFNDSNPQEETVYYILLFPGILLIFYPTTFGIQNDEDTRILEILFGIPNYRYKVWLVRLILMLGITYLVMIPLAYIGSLSIFVTDAPKMAGELMFPVFFLGCLGFMFSTIIRNGNGTAVVMIIVGVAFWISAGILDESPWNIFLNPFSLPPNDMNELVWENTLFKNRVYLSVGSVLAMLYGLVNLRKREKFV